MAYGLFITFEGGEGSGKSTQARLLAERLAAAGHEVVLTREPGGAPGAEAIRDLLVTGNPDRWSPLAETLLFSAARDEHLRRTIVPALDRGSVVVSDRFADSTRAYQGAAGGVEPELINTLEAAVMDRTRPHLTFLLDLKPETGMARAAGRPRADKPNQNEDRFERKPAGFHNALRAEFLAIARGDPDRCIVLDAAGDPAALAAEVWSVVQPRLQTREAGNA